MGDKAYWSDGFVRNSSDACKEKIEVANRPNKQFTSLVGRTSFPSLHKNPVTSEQRNN
jgi:hypothetical protein